MSFSTETASVVDHRMAVEMAEESGYRYWAVMPDSEVSEYISSAEERGELLSELSHAASCDCGVENIYA